MTEKRVELATKYLQSLDIGSKEDIRVKSRSEYRDKAAILLTLTDHELFSPENVKRAFSKTEYDTDTFLKPFLAVMKELRTNEIFVIEDLHEAWAQGHEGGFWDGRLKEDEEEVPKFEGKLPDPDKSAYSEEDIEAARQAGYVAGFDNGVQTLGTIGDDLLIGKEHADAHNPFPLPPQAHTLWCRGGHDGPCRRGVQTGTEKG